MNLIGMALLALACGCGGSGTPSEYPAGFTPGIVDADVDRADAPILDSNFVAIELSTPDGLGPLTESVIAYRNDDALHLISPDRSRSERIGAFHLRGWSPDGAWMVLREETTRQHYLRHTDSASELIPMGSDHVVWSPDSERVLLDSMNLLRLSDRSESQIATDGIPVDWSSDGQWILFYRRVETDNSFNANRTVYAIRSDGSEEHDVVVTSELFTGFEPGGLRFIYNGLADGAASFRMLDIFGNQAARLGSYDRTPFAPKWSPSGTRLLFFEDNGDNVPITIRTPSGSLTQQIGVGFGATWSPDERSIAFQTRNDAIFVAAVGDTTVRRVCKGDAHSWAPDGSRLAVHAVAQDTRLDFIAIVNGDGQDPVFIARGTDPSWSP